MFASKPAANFTLRTVEQAPLTAVVCRIDGIIVDFHREKEGSFKKMMRKIVFVLAAIATNVLAFSQSGSSSAEHSETKYRPTVVDPLYGIQMYEAFNMILGRDTVKKNSKGMAAQGIIIEHYIDNTVLHEGYYIDGKLRNYVNFYPNGKREREFKMVDYNEGDMSYYYQDGTLKSTISYRGKFAKSWSDYNQAGVLVYHEKFNETLSYYEFRKSFFEGGQPKYSFTLQNAKKMIFEEKEFYPSGALKSAGKVEFRWTIRDYTKIKKWVYHNADGSPLKTHKFKDGRLVKESWN